MQLSIQHTTRYRFSQPLLYSVQTLHLWPASSSGQTVRHWAIRVPGTLYEQPASLGNRQHGFTLTARPEDNVRELSIVAGGLVDTHGQPRFNEPSSVPPAFYCRSSALAEPHPRLTAWARQVVPGWQAGQPVDEALVLALASAVADRVRYRPGNTGVETTALEAFDWGLGVCQDQAHVMVAICRGLGLPARYVSGYFFAENEPELASHAWADVCLDAATALWLSVDVTHRCLTDERHIRLAAATDYAACLPVKGVRLGGGDESMDVQVRIHAF